MYETKIGLLNSECASCFIIFVSITKHGEDWRINGQCFKIYMAYSWGFLSEKGKVDGNTR